MKWAHRLVGGWARFDAAVVFYGQGMGGWVRGEDWKEFFLLSIGASYSCLLHL